MVCSRLVGRPPAKPPSRRPSASGAINSTAPLRTSKAFFPAQAADQQAFDRATIRNWPKELRRRGHAHGPGALFRLDVAAYHAVNDRIGGSACAAPISTPAVMVNRKPVGDSAMPTRPSPYSAGRRPRSRGSAEAVGRHAPAKMPNTPQDRFCTASAKARVSRVQPLGLGDGLQPQPETVAYAHGQRDDGGAADQHLQHGEFFGVGGHGRSP